jgi:urease accessory protein
MKTPAHTLARFQPALFLFALLCVPSLAQAHPGHPGQASGWVNGLLHPLSGFDHLCAMIAVGLWAAQRGGRALWMVPLSFVSVMALGGLLGLNGVPVPFAEQGIAASVLVLGLLLAASARLTLAASALIVGIFALCHGYAHGAEMPATASGFSYGLGFIAATTALLLCGISLGLLTQRLGSTRLVRCMGVLIAAFGLYLFCSV